jgi:hypothetical protein
LPCENDQKEQALPRAAHENGRETSDAYAIPSTVQEKETALVAVCSVQELQDCFVLNVDRPSPYKFNGIWVLGSLFRVSTSDLSMKEAETVQKDKFGTVRSGEVWKESDQLGPCRFAVNSTNPAGGSHFFHEISTKVFDF